MMFVFLQLACKLHEHWDIVYFDVTPIFPAPVTIPGDSVGIQ